MRSTLSPSLLVGLAGLLSLAAACGDDSGTGGAGGGAGGSGDGGATASSTSGGPSSTSTGTPGVTTSTGSTNPQTTAAGTGGDPTGTGGDPTGTGGDPTGTGGDPTGTGGDPTGGTGGETAGTGGDPTGGTGGETAGTGGAPPDCEAITVDEITFRFNNGRAVYAGTSSNFAGAGEDLVGAFLGDDTAGTYDLADEVDFGTCTHCVLGNVDVDPDTGDFVTFFAESGNITLEDGGDLANGFGEFSLANVVLREATLDDDGVVTFVQDGGCAFLDAAAFSAEAPVVPADWTCNPVWYGDQDCDCGCGAQDADCEGTADVGECAFCGGCDFDCELVDPADTTECLDEPGVTTSASASTGGGNVPADWTCNPVWYGDDDCDCGCGAQDADCAGTADVGECAFCGGCDFDCDLVDPTDTTECL